MSYKKKYSVIIPVYNAAKTLERCLESVICQQRTDVEIIVVNDGSCDESGQIISDFMKSNDNIICITQENAGVSHARNAGLSKAAGEYITFIDSDDYVEQNYFSELDRMGREEDSDLIIFSYHLIGGLDETVRKQYEILTQAQTREKKLELLLSGREIMQPWNKRFRRSVIEQNHLRFIEELLAGEDMNFCLAYAMCSKSVQVYNTAIYTEDISDTASLSRKYRPQLDEQMRIAFESAALTIQNGNTDDSEKQTLLAITDYLYVKNVFSCITEEFKRMKPNYRKQKSRIIKISENFTEQLSEQYWNRIHRILRWLLQKNHYFVFYAVSAVMKRKMYRQYLTENS